MPFNSHNSVTFISKKKEGHIRKQCVKCNRNFFKLILASDLTKRFEFSYNFNLFDR